MIELKNFLPLLAMQQQIGNGVSVWFWNPCFGLSVIVLRLG